MFNYLSALQKGEDFEKMTKEMDDLFGVLMDSYEMFAFNENTKNKIGELDKSKRVCRYCNKRSPEVSFRKVAHSISEALGNKKIITNDECDACNEKFGKGIENDLILYLNLYRVFFGIRGKKGIPKFKGKNFEIENIETIKIKQILSDEEINSKIVPGVKIVAVTQVSNVLGTINDVKKIAKKAHEVGAIIVIDAAQSAPHMKIDVQDLDADFLVFSGHKMLAPMGIGVLYGKEEILNKMEPFNLGGDMIEYVYEQETTYAEPPMKFEAGTQNVNGAVGLSAAIDYLENIGMENVEKIEAELLQYAYEELTKLDFIQIYGPTNLEKRAAVIAFNVKNVHPHDVSTILNNSGVCIRSGHHCAQPLHRKLKMESTCRASFYIYNTKEDCDKLVEAILATKEFFNGTL